MQDLVQQEPLGAGALHRVSASSADHYRAIPLSDGHHILFTDPRTGNLCLGTDAPASSLNRLLRKIWFRPPSMASSSAPVLYTAGTDTRHGVRVVATFSISVRDDIHDKGTKGDLGAHHVATQDTNYGKQIIVFYTIPPDMFHDISCDSLGRGERKCQTDQEEAMISWIIWRPEENYHAIDICSDPFRDSAVYPLEIEGQPMAICSGLVELSLDSGPNMVLWAFSADGWARTWAMDTGIGDLLTQTAVQQNGGIRHVDDDGDIVMANVENPTSAVEVSASKPTRYDGGGSYNEDARLEMLRAPPERYRRMLTGWGRDRMSGTVSVDVVEEVSGIARMDVELR